MEGASWKCVHCHSIGEDVTLDNSWMCQDLIYYSLAALYGLIGAVALIQLVRIEHRVPEFGWTTQKVSLVPYNPNCLDDLVKWTGVVDRFLCHQNCRHDYPQSGCRWF